MMDDLGLDLFGGHSLEEIPESYNLEPRDEPYEVIVDSVEAKETKAGGKYGIAVNYKDISEDGFGLTAFQWIGFPVERDKAQYLLRDLRKLNLSNEQIREFAKNVSGTPDDATVNLEAINDLLVDSVGLTGTLKVTEYINKRTDEPGINVNFTLDDPMDPGTKEEPQEKAAPADTSEWFNE